MISPDEFISSWIYTRLVQYDPSSVQNLSIPDGSKQFLIEAGLPLDDDFAVPTNTLPTLQAYYSDQNMFSSEIQNYRLLGVSLTEQKNIYAFYCLDEVSSGKVMRVHREWGVEWGTKVLNSSIPQYAESLLRLRNYRHWLNKEAYEDLDDPDEPYVNPSAFHQKVKAVGQTVLQQLRTIDPLAFRPGTAWETEMYFLEGGAT